MAAFDDEPAPSAHRSDHRIGQDLGALSVDELAARVAALTREIARLQGEIAAKSAQKSAADLLFRR